MKSISEKYRRKLMRDAAEAVCWGLVLSISTGLSPDEFRQMLAEDFDRWVNLVDWENYK